MLSYYSVFSVTYCKSSNTAPGIDYFNLTEEGGRGVIFEGSLFSKDDYSYGVYSKIRNSTSKDHMSSF